MRGERDWHENAEKMASQELKVMRRIKPQAVAVEACITHHGTLVGPVTDLTGYRAPPTGVAGAGTTSFRRRCQPNIASAPGN